MQIKEQKLLMLIDIPKDIDKVENWDDLMDPSKKDAMDVRKIKAFALSNIKIKWIETIIENGN